MKEVFYMLLYSNGDYVALDDASGGCHYRTKDFTTAKKWNIKFHAESYPTKGEVFKLIECEVVFKELSTISK
jgi:hypothetical protein